MKVKPYIFLIFCIAISGCSVLSKSQLQDINQFASYTKNYSNFPGEVVKQSAELHYNNNIFEASSLTDTTEINQAVNKANLQLAEGKIYEEKLDVSLQLIQKYSSLLEQLSSNKYKEKLGDNTKELSENLYRAVNLFNSKVPDKIPGNVGESIAKVITTIGSSVIKSQQSKALKKIIPVGDTLIQITAKNIVDVLISDLKPLLEQYSDNFKHDFNTIIFKHPGKLNYNLLQFYVQTNSNFTSAELLRQTSVEAAKKMALSHSQLKNNITTKKNITEMLSETKNFISDIKTLHEVYENLLKNKK